MTNPDDIVRVRARLEGRASVYEANGWAQAYTTGLLSGNGVLPNTVPDMNVLVGGSQDNPDVVIAQNANGYKIALDIVGQQAITITAPASQSRISAIVAYTDDLSLASTDSATTGSPSSCGLIVVNGNTASTPTEPSEATIRSAITADGATGSQACYCVIATILVSSSTTTISTSLITPKTATLAGSGVVSATNIDFTTLWPVGSYYETSDLSFDPNISWGGTWVQDSKARTTFAYDSTVTEFDTVGKTGGTLKHAHSFLGLTTTDVVAGGGVIGTQNYTNDASTLPQYVVVVRWHRTA